MRKLASFFVIALSGIMMWQLLSPSVQSKTDLAGLEFSPWASIGGCGAGGSGGGGGDGIQWVGQGVSGGSVNIEVLPKFSAGQNFSTYTFPIRASFKPLWNLEVGASIPFMSKQGEVQYRTNQEPKNRMTGGTGDLSIDANFSMGPSAQYGLSVGLSVPTGQYDIVRGPDAAKEFLPASLQKGSGLFSSTVGLSFSRDVDDGIWLHSVSYAHPWNSRFMSGQNEFMDSWLSNYQGIKDKRFYYDWKSYGENDLGDFTPPSLSFTTHYGYRGIAGFVHSVGLTFGIPMGVAWIRSEKVGVYDPKPDPDHKAWTAAIVYGLEFSRDEYPIFFAFSLPIHDKANAPNANEYDETPMSEWNAPDYEDLFQQWTIALGIKTSVW